MSKAGKTTFVFACYLWLIGTWLLLHPNSMLAIFGMPEAQDVWVRVVGLLVLILGVYYTVAARSDFTALIQWSVYVRSSVILFFGAFVLAGLAPPVLLVFGVVDLLAAGWTEVALRSDRAAGGAR